MVADLALRDPRSPPVEQEAGRALSRWDVLRLLEKGAVGARRTDGAVEIDRSEPAGCFLYGPYLHLPRGRYRLTFRCPRRSAADAAQPVLGVEIIVLSRFQQQWRDFTGAELAGGSGALDFEVPARAQPRRR